MARAGARFASPVTDWPTLTLQVSRLPGWLSCGSVCPATWVGAGTKSGESGVAEQLRVDADSLQGDGRNLAALGSIPDSEGCPAPAADPVSTSMAFALTGHEEALRDKLRYAKRVREHGGAIVTAAGVMFEVADKNAALDISRVEVDHETRPASAAAAAMPVLPPQPEPPPRPRIPGVLDQTMEPEAFAEAIHSGQGAGRVRDFSTHFRKIGDDVEYTADQTTHTGNQIDEHWPDSSSNAASNVRDHGRWMKSASQWGQRLSGAAESAASAFDYAHRDTPKPDEFEHARRILEIQERMGTQRTIDAAQRELDYLIKRARVAGSEYHMRVESAVLSVGDPIISPPLIARRAAIPQNLVRGPGEWVTESRRDGPWRNYEMQATGYPTGMEYEVPGPDGPVQFDGYDPDVGEEGLLVEAKGNGYAWMVGDDGQFRPETGAAVGIPKELLRQYEVASELGIPVEWRVSEPKAAAAIQEIIEAQGYDDLIHVTVVPAE